MEGGHVHAGQAVAGGRRAHVVGAVVRSVWGQCRLQCDKIVELLVVAAVAVVAVVVAAVVTVFHSDIFKKKWRTCSFVLLLLVVN